jgi:purine nucleosidase
LLERILIDTDPGVDDALAILFALRHPEIEVVALTPVAGNVGLTNTARNALYLTEIAGRPDIPVAIGCERPLVRPLEDAAYAHGNDGLHGLSAEPKSKTPDRRHAVDLIIEASKQYPGELTVAAVGPLTNVALALLKDPGLAQRLKGIYIMGGAVWESGNVTPAGEFNIWCDPEAAQVVFRSGARISMVGLDVTHKAPVGRKEQAILAARTGDSSCRFIADLLETSFQLGRTQVAVHDLLTVAAIVAPELIEWEELAVDVEVQSEITRGLTLADRRAWRRSTEQTRTPIRVAKTVNQERFVSMFLSTMTRA